MGNIGLEELANVDIRSVEKHTLVDIENITIDMTLDRAGRVSSFLEQVKNPYCFLCNGVIVKMRFAQTEATLEDKLNSYFKSLPM